MRLDLLTWLKARKNRAPTGPGSKSSGGGSVEVEKAGWSSHPLWTTPTKRVAPAERATPPASKWWLAGTAMWSKTAEWSTGPKPLRSEVNHPTNTEQSPGEQGQMTNPPQISPPPKTVAPTRRGAPPAADERLIGDTKTGGRLNAVEQALKILMLALVCMFLLIASLYLAAVLIFGSRYMHGLGLLQMSKAGVIREAIAELFGKPSPASSELEVVHEWAKDKPENLSEKPSAGGFIPLDAQGRKGSAEAFLDAPDGTSNPARPPKRGEIRQ